jgi:addiction module RelB/DinJ family antitoxin
VSIVLLLQIIGRLIIIQCMKGKNGGNNMPTTENLTMRVDSDLKHDAADCAAEIGMPLTTAVTVFLKKFVADRGFPWQVQAPARLKPEVLEAYKEAEEAYKRGEATEQSPTDFLAEMGYKA